MLFPRQVLVLAYKNTLIAFIRRPVSTLLRALALPILIAWFFSYARNFFAAPARYGIGTPNPVRSLQDAFAYSGSRNSLVFVNNGYTDGQIEQVIDEVGDIARSAGKNVVVVQQESDLLIECRNSWRGSSRCFAGVVFYSSPTEPAGQGKPYSYALRYDGILGASVFMDQTTNDQEIYLLPLQKAIDRAIARVNGTLNVDVVDELDEFPYTAADETQRITNLRTRYMWYIYKFLGVGFFIGMCGIQYQQVGAQATERETRMAQLLEVMMPNRRRWQPQIARLLSYHLAFTVLYFPGWLIMGIMVKRGVFQQTSMGIVVGIHLLTGLSLASFSLFAAAFFKRAQLSGISTIFLSLVIAIIVQVTPLNVAAVYVLSVIFPSVDYVLFINFMARFERMDRSAVLDHISPGGIPGRPIGGFWWIVLVIQIFVYPLLAIVVERSLWGTASGKRHLSSRGTGPAVELRHFSKHFRPNWFSQLFSCCVSDKRMQEVRAADDLNFVVHRGQIVVLLGANGSGKSTTLDAIAGLSKPTSGDIMVGFDNGIGFCPQQNVLWKDLTVYEHVKIFDHLKSTGKRASKRERINLISDCDLNMKIYDKAGSLSGGQMRKLQLASMFIGGSGICLVDECSSGIDPLARKKVQDILLAERSRSQRTIIFTSHYLDEADIADHILIMSKGKLKVQGTAPEIKHSGQYKIHIYHGPGQEAAPSFESIARKEMYDQTIYNVENATAASKLLTEIESKGFRDYSVNGPTVEDAFMAVAEEMVPSSDRVYEVPTTCETVYPKDVQGATGRTTTDVDSDCSRPKGLNLHPGKHIGPFRQAVILFWKRCVVFFRGPWPNLVVLIIVPLAAGLVSKFLVGFQRAGCASNTQDLLTEARVSLADLFAPGPGSPVLGPQPAWNSTALSLITQVLPPTIPAAAGNPGPPGGAGGQGAISSITIESYLAAVPFVSSADALYEFVASNTQRVFPGGIYLGGTTGEPPMIGYYAQSPEFIYFPVLLQNIVNIIRYQNPISLSYQPFDIPWQAGQGNTLQYVIYFELVLCVAPAFFALYPTLERLRHVRSLHYSNGVRALPLWLSYLMFDMIFVIAAATVSVAVLAGRFNAVIFGIGEFWFVMVLFGLCATLCSYVVSFFARSQLAAFAIAAAYQAATGLLWFLTYLSLVTYGDPNYIDRNLNIANFTMSLIMPAGSLYKALFVSLNVLSVNCRSRDEYVGSPWAITAYGGPILYLVLQSGLLFALIVWWDSGNKFGNFFRLKRRSPDHEEKRTSEHEVLEEIDRVTTSEDDGLKVLHLSKAYGRNLAVDDATFGVKRGEVFGLLGPNGAGKSTTISVVRGDLKADDGDIVIDNLSLRRKRNHARQHLSACPQYDAMDRLTVTEHLQFYARVRGVNNVKHNVREIIRAVGLTRFEHRMAEKLSGGNKRKLSLGIALMGNPTVMLLDEPSSGMDVAAKRVMWRTLEAVVGGRSIVLTTHSMEEADRLCNRAGILATRMLTVGTIDYLKKKHGDRYYVLSE
ncbi:hypothetical protein R6Q59_010165 [Mikania micrantha]